jgi:hypothetical protein
MTDELTDGERLCLQMRRIRGRMHTKVDSLLVDAQSLLDWRYYVSRFPWTSVLVAAGVAFWLTPGHRVTRTVRLDDESIDELARQSESRSQAIPRRAGWIAPLVSVAGSLALKTALAYLGQQLVQRTAATARTPAEEAAA